MINCVLLQLLYGSVLVNMALCLDLRLIQMTLSPTQKLCKGRCSSLQSACMKEILSGLAKAPHRGLAVRSELLIPAGHILDGALDLACDDLVFINLLDCSRQYRTVCTTQIRPSLRLANRQNFQMLTGTIPSACSPFRLFSF